MSSIAKEAKLPDTIIMEEDFRRYRQTWMTVISKAQAAYDKICDDKDVGNDLPDFEKLNSEWAKTWVEEKVKAVMADTNLTYNAKTRLAQEWQSIGDDLLSAVVHIEAVHNLDPDAKVELAGCHIIIPNMDELLTAKTTYKVPTKYKRLYELIGTAKETVDQMVAYKVKNDLFETIDPMALLRFAGSGESFARVCYKDEDFKKVREEEKAYMQEEARQKHQHEIEIRKAKDERCEQLDEVAAERRRRGEEVPIHRVTVHEKSDTNASGLQETVL